MEPTSYGVWTTPGLDPRTRLNGSGPPAAVELSGDERADVPMPDELRYLRLKVLRAGALVRPDVSRTAIVTV